MLEKSIGRSNNVVKKFKDEKSCKLAIMQKLPPKCVRAEKRASSLVMYFQTQHDAECYYKTL